jgi:hypothetical protein
MLRPGNRFGDLHSPKDRERLYTPALATDYRNLLLRVSGRGGRRTDCQRGGGFASGYPLSLLPR